jgi:hypothetical protein
MKKQNSFSVVSLSLIALVTLVGCTPADIKYCRDFGVEGTVEYGKCVDYYQAQTAAFSADRAVCSNEADATYPPSLYDFGHYATSVGGFGAFGSRGGFYGGPSIRIEPDYRHNAQVDALRMRIIEPCMQAKGWNSGRSWQAGRHAVSAPPRKLHPQTNEVLPWTNPRTGVESQAEVLPWLK